MRNENSRKPLDLWQAPPDAGDPLVCVATSFTFDSIFFETECLGRFLGMSNHPSESESVGYLVEREEKLASATVCAIVDRRHARDKESLRWDVLGVLLPNGIQHSKIGLLAWGNHVRVIIGSGNLTEPGYRSNLEVFGAIDVSREDGGARQDVGDTISFLEKVTSYSVGKTGPNTPKDRALQALASVRRLISRWPESGSNTGSPVFGAPGKGVLQQLGTVWPTQTPPKVASVVSPFFDRGGKHQVTVKELTAVLKTKRNRKIRLYVRADDLPNGQTRVYAPRELIKKARATCDLQVFPVSHIQEEDIRQLHAKMLRLENDQNRLLLIGSSNFTSAGIAGHGNLEANLAYVAKRSTSQFTRLRRIWPETGNEFDLDSIKLVWDPEPEQLEDGRDVVPVPDCFQEAIYYPDKSRLELTLSNSFPPQWSIRIPNGIEILSSSKKVGAGVHTLDWQDKAVPFILEVSWTVQGRTCVGSWPVNVSNPAVLPPPEELRGLTLEQMLEILSSVRPLPEAVVHALLKGKRGPGNGGDELNPLRRHDPITLLRRTKRVAAALERLRERLESPATTREAFDWRLNGAIGPRTLAEAFVREATLQGEARFYLAELALSLSRVNTARAAAGGLSRRTIRHMLTTSIRDLKKQSKQIPCASNSPLEFYVNAAFREALR